MPIILPKSVLFDVAKMNHWFLRKYDLFFPQNPASV